MKLVEPPSCSSASTIVFIGRNSRGNWVVQEQNGLFGGLFVNRTQAIRYALFENGHHPETIVELKRAIEEALQKGDFFDPERAEHGRPVSHQHPSRMRRAHATCPRPGSSRARVGTALAA